MTYAKGTQVSPDRTKTEIENTLRRYGATAFASVSNWQTGYEVIAFEYNGRTYRLQVPQPDYDACRWTPTRMVRNEKGQKHAFDQAVRQRWRAMLLYIKATLEAVDAGIINLETALLPYMLLPGGSTFTEWAEPQVEWAVEQGQMPPMLPGIQFSAGQLPPCQEVG